MRRFVAALLLVVVGLGAVYCIDGCADPTADRDVPGQGADASTCVVCVVPFTTTPIVSDEVVVSKARILTDPHCAHLWDAPTFSIDHPPRIL